MQSTPLCGPKIGAFLKPRFGTIAFPIYGAARLMGNPLGGLRVERLWYISNGYKYD
jgi:hypothetical protein